MYSAWMALSSPHNHGGWHVGPAVTALTDAENREAVGRHGDDVPLDIDCSRGTLVTPPTRKQTRSASIKDVLDRRALVISGAS
jgi:hypothetical protein